LRSVIVVVSNWPEKSEEEPWLRKALEEELEEKVQEVHYRDPDLERVVLETRIKAVIAGGSPALITDPQVQKDYSEEIRVLQRLNKPLLGICHGHQLIALAFGGSVSMLKERVNGYQRIDILREDPLFDGLKEHFTAWEAHREAVSNLPKGFILLARSESCAAEAMRREGSPIYGVQFHPERWNDEHPEGLRILENFLKIADTPEKRTP